MKISSKWPGGVGVLGVVAVLGLQCGGATSPSSPDASLDGAGSSSASSGAGGSSGSASGGSTSGGSSGGGCSPACGMGFTCCSGQCVNEYNDPYNCGGCGLVCPGAAPYCEGQCKTPPCQQEAGACGSGTCCGTQCCGQGQTCCLFEEGPWITQCNTPTPGGPQCPLGCPECQSDRHIKRDIEPVDSRAVLDAVARMPVATWSYKRDDPSVRHMGPMAQDFRAAFGLGDTDRAYYPVDANGVAFASIQALYAQMQEQGARIERLEKENTDLRRQCR